MTDPPAGAPEAGPASAAEARRGLAPSVRHLFAEAEQRAERGLAVIRLISVLVLIGAFLTARHAGPWQAMAGVLTAYAGLAVGGLVLALRGGVTPPVAWLLATLEAALLVGFVASILAGPGVAPADAIGMPATLLAFLFVAQAALRYRPGLVAWTGAIVVAGLGALIWLSLEPGAAAPEAGAGAAPPVPHGLMMRGLIFALVTAILTGAVWRARRLLRLALAEGLRRENLARYVPSRVARRIAEEGAPVAQEQRAAVLFADIRGFTSLSENLEGAAVAAILARFRHLALEAVEAEGGLVDKFVGDGVMAVFGVPDPAAEGPARDAAAAVGAARRLDAAVADWAAERAAEGLAPIGVGIGVHVGTVLAGSFGGEDRLEFTVIGDTVNVAERIEEATRTLETPILVSADTLTAAGIGLDDSDWREVGDHEIRGRRRPVRLFRPARPRAPSLAADDRGGG